jgi:hypothetical protein
MKKWVPVFGLEGFYEVSSDGDVRSIPRGGVTSYGKRMYGGNELKHISTSSGYPSVNLTKKGFRKQFLVHRIVLESFVGPAPEGMEACHQNGVRSDCRLSNLRWDTRSNNALDKRNHGTWQGGENNGNTSLKNKEAIEIRKSKLSAEKLSKIYNVSKTTIYRIKHKELWQYVN